MSTGWFPHEAGMCALHCVLYQVILKEFQTKEKESSSKFSVLLLTLLTLTVRLELASFIFLWGSKNCRWLRIHCCLPVVIAPRLPGSANFL